MAFSSVITFSHKNRMLDLIKQRVREAMVSYMLPNRSLICPSKPRETWDPSGLSGGGDAGGWLWLARQGDAGLRHVTAHLGRGEM